MNKVSSPSPTATGQCVGLGGVGKAWQGTFETSCEECQGEEATTQCKIRGSVELLCCNQHSTGLSDQATYIINLFKYDDFSASGLLASSGGAEQCEFGAICGYTFADTVNSDWTTDSGCSGATCNGMMNTSESITIYDPANPPSDINSHDCGGCPEDVSFELNFADTGSLRMPMVALDAKTGKPLSFIV